MLEGFTNIMEEERQEDSVSNVDVKNIITNLNLYTNDSDTLTMLYTNILKDENVVYIMTRVSQNPVFMKHFPEFYITNSSGESVINCQQNSPYHKYGVFKHILYTIEYVGQENPKLNSDDLRILKWTMFLHDIGKPEVKTTNGNGNDSFGGHEDASFKIAQEILDRFNFTEHEKKIILTLIKYHDRYLNEGELTRDNLEFLANELENKRELFNLLIEVKLSDNKAKSIEVNNRFILAAKKYYEFADAYFAGKGEVQYTISNECSNSMDEYILRDGNTKDITDSKQNLEEELEDIKVEEKHEGVDIKKETLTGDCGVTDENFSSLYRGLLNEKIFNFFYQPIVSFSKKEIIGYEVCAELNIGNKINIENVIKKSRDFKKYDRVQQIVFINTLDNFSKIGLNKKILGFINIDLDSYDKYVNKGRIFDVLDNGNIVVSFYNYSKHNNTKLNKMIVNIKEKGGSVLLNNYDDNNLNISSLNIINPDYIKYCLPREKASEPLKNNIKEMLTYCIASETRFVLSGIKTVEDFELAIDCGAELLQGEYFGEASESLNFDKSLQEKLNFSVSEDEKIV